jgi:hypothetical protein
MSLNICARCSERIPSPDGQCNGNCACNADEQKRPVTVLIQLGCPLKKFPPRRRYLHGLIGILKSILGIGLASTRTIAARRVKCKACDQCELKLGEILTGCKQCGCAIAMKIKQKKESCPLGKWPQEPAQEISKPR